MKPSVEELANREPAEPRAPKNRDELMNELLAQTRDLQAAEAAKKCDAKLHAERISEIKGGIREITDQLKALEDATTA
jgi:hypothetical protein